MGKGEIACNKQFLLFPQCFLPVWRSVYHFHQTSSRRLQTISVWKSLELVIWERVNICHNFPLVSDNVFMFHMSCVFLLVRPFLWHRGQGQISRSHFSENGYNLGISVLWTKLWFHFVQFLSYLYCIPMAVGPIYVKKLWPTFIFYCTVYSKPYSRFIK